jgi:hypothetical protein
MSSFSRNILAGAARRSVKTSRRSNERFTVPIGTHDDTRVSECAAIFSLSEYVRFFVISWG